MSVKLSRLMIAMAASVLGVILTAVLWKPGVIAGAALAPVIALFVESSFGEPLIRRVQSDPIAEARNTPRESFYLSITTGLIGFAIVAGVLTIPPLVEGDALKDTPLVTGEVPGMTKDDDGGSGAVAGNGEDPDPDGDGLVGKADNCPTVSNPDQENSNKAGRGDACDPDDDNDHIDDDVPDNCRAIKNPGQEDADSNGVGDACQDSDEDGHFDAVDNCPTVANAGQENLDEDLFGDACDDDRDGDGVTDDVDAAPDDPNLQ